MQKKKTIKKLSLMLVFLFSFVFQTAYSLSFNVASVKSSDYWHKHLDKSSAREEMSENSFIEKEKETENDNELNYELLTFVVPHFIFHIEFTTPESFTSTEKTILYFNKESIFITVRSIRI